MTSAKFFLEKWTLLYTIFLPNFTSKPFLNQNIQSRNILVEYREIPYSPKDYDVMIINDITIKMNFFNHLTQKLY